MATWSSMARSLMWTMTRVPVGAVFGGEDAGYGVGVEGVGSEAVDGFGGEGDGAAVAKNFGGAGDVFEDVAEALGCAVGPAHLAGELAGEGVEGEGAEEVAAHAALDLVEAAGGVFDPGEGEGVVEAIELGAEVGVADEFGGAGVEEEEVFEEEREGAEESGGFLLAFGSGAVGLGHLEEGGVVGLGGGVAKEEERVGAGGDVGGEVEAEGFAGGSLGEAGDEGALLRGDVGAAVGEEHLDLFDR